MRVNYVTFCDERMPAYRYRMKLPGEYIGDYSITQFPEDADIHVFSKPYHSDPELLAAFISIAEKYNFVFDVCDDIFSREGHVPDYMRHMTHMATVVTTPTEAMHDRVKEETGVESVVISDPCEFDEQPIKAISEPRVMWFGSATNFDILKYVKCQYHVEIVCHPDMRKRLHAVHFDHSFTEWSLDNMKAAFKRNNIVIIPTFMGGNKNHNYMIKSPNRVFESIRNGLSVVASPIPSYQQFADYITLDWDIEKGLDRVKQLTPDAQKYVRDNFDISVIGEKWKRLFKTMKSGSISDVGAGSLMVG